MSWTFAYSAADELTGYDNRPTLGLETDVAYISYFTCLATVSSIVQQLYDYTLWREIMIEQFYYGKAHANDAETQYQRGIMGLKLALSYIRGSFPPNLANDETSVCRAGRSTTSARKNWVEIGVWSGLLQTHELTRRDSLQANSASS